MPMSLVPPQYCRQASPGSYANISVLVLLSWVLVLVACLTSSALQSHNSKSLFLPSHQIIQGKKRNCPCIICAHVLLPSSSVLSLSHELLSCAVPCAVYPLAVPCAVYPLPSLFLRYTCIQLSHKFKDFCAKMLVFLWYGVFENHPSLEGTQPDEQSRKNKLSSHPYWL